VKDRPFRPANTGAFAKRAQNIGTRASIFGARVMERRENLWFAVRSMLSRGE